MTSASPTSIRPFAPRTRRAAIPAQREVTLACSEHRPLTNRPTGRPFTLAALRAVERAGHRARHDARFAQYVTGASCSMPNNTACGIRARNIPFGLKDNIPEFVITKDDVHSITLDTGDAQDAVPDLQTLWFTDLPNGIAINAVAFTYQFSLSHPNAAGEYEFIIASTKTADNAWTNKQLQYEDLIVVITDKEYTAPGIHFKTQVGNPYEMLISV